MAQYKIPSLPAPPPSANLRESVGSSLSPTGAASEGSHGADMSAASSSTTSQSGLYQSISRRTTPVVRRFDMAMLMPQISTICNAHLSHAKWDSSKVKDWGRLVGDAVKQRMVEQEPRGYKYVVSVSLSQNLGQQGRGDAQTHWDPESDSLSGQVWSNESIIATILVAAIKTAY